MPRLPPKHQNHHQARRHRLGEWEREATVLIHEILATAERLAAARDGAGRRIMRAEADAKLLAAIARSHGCPSISDLARALRISRQAAHRLVSSAARAGRVNLCPNVDDRRILQVELTAVGRALLNAERSTEASWVITLLNGLDRREIARIAEVLAVIRRRLARAEWDRTA